MTEIEKLEKRKEQLDARIKMKKAQHNQNYRKKDTRCKVIVGAGIIKLLKTDRLNRSDFDKLMTKSLSERDLKWLVENLPNKL